MMAANGKVNFHIDHVLVRFKKASEPMAEAIALQMEAYTKDKITSNRQIDTGFMRNATYIVSRRLSTFGKANASGVYQGKKRKLAPQVSLPSNALAACANGAAYAIFQEEKKPFMYPAAVKTAADVHGKAEKVFKENLT